MNDKQWYAIGLDLTPLKKQVREAQDEFRKIDKVAFSEGQKIDKTFRGIGASLKSLVPVASFATAGLMLKQLATDAYRFERSFSMAMREVQTISQAVEKDFKGISDELMNLAANGPDNAIQLAQAYYQIVSAGHDGAKGLEILRVSSEAATAGLTETKIAADGITTVLNAWGKDASEAANIADVMFKTVEKGKTTFPELASNIAQVAPLASSMNVSFEEITGAIATLTKQGTPTAQAMTQIRSSLVNMTKALGDGWSDAYTYQEALQKVAEMAGGSQTELRKLIPDIEGMNAVLSLTGDKAKEAAGDLEAMTTATGAMKSAYDKMMKEADNQWSMVHNKWQRELKGLGEAITSSSINIAKVLNELLTNREEDIIKPEVKQAIAGFTAELDSLGDREEKLEIITKKILEIRNATSELRDEEAKLAKQQPGGLQKGVEAFNRGLGLGPAYSPGLIKEKELEIIQEDIDINERVQQELAKLYQQVLSTEDVELKVDDDKNKRTEKLKTLRNALENIKTLKDQLGTGTIQQDVEIYLKIAEEQRFVDETLQKVREQLKEALSDNIETKPILGLSTKGLISKKEIREQLKPMKQLTDEELKRLKIQNQQLDNLHDQQALYEEIAEGFEGVSEIVGALSFAVGELDEEIGYALGRMADLAFNASNLAANIANQNYVGAVASGIGLIGNIFAMFKQDEASRTEQQLENINRTLERQSTILASMSGENYFNLAQKQAEEYYKAIEEGEKKLMQNVSGYANAAYARWSDAYSNYQQKQQERFREQAISRGYRPGTGEYDEYLQQMMSTILDIDNWIANNAPLELPLKFWDADQIIEAWTKGNVNLGEEAVDAILGITETQSAINNLLAETWDKITGNSRESIADAIIDGFRNGYRSAEDFADNFEEIMKTAIINALKTKMIEGSLTDWYQGFYEAAKDGLTEDEIEEQQKLWNKMVEGQKVLFDSMKEATGIDLQNIEKGYEKLTGISSALTEETGSIIAGQFTAMRFDLKAIDENTKQAVDYLMQGLAYWEQIAANTSYNKHLKTIDEKMDKMNRTLNDRL